MTPTMIASFARQFLTFVGGILVATGWIDSGTMAEIVGALATLVSVAWSFFTHSGTVIVPKAEATPQQLYDHDGDL